MFLQKVSINYFYILFLQLYTFSANLKEHKLWLKSLSLGLTFTIISVLELPPKYSYKTLVNLLFLYGIWACFVARAVITSPRDVKLLFICKVSFNLSPSTLLWLKRSLPAKSIRFKVPLTSPFSVYPFIFN